MKRVAFLVAVFLVLAGPAVARTATPHASPTPVTPSRAPAPLPPQPPSAPSPAAARPAPPLPMLPSVARVRVESGRDRLLVFEDVNLPRGQWQSGGLDLFVAFGAPGTPIAIDARLVAAVPSSEGVSVDSEGAAVALELAPRVPPSANLLLGTRRMAGVILHLREADLRRAFTASGAAVLRMRILLSAPVSDPAGSRDVVLRLGAPQGTPLTLEAIEVVSIDRDRPFTRVEARLCGPDADTRPLAVRGRPSGSIATPSDAAPIDPSQVVRHGSDDLCIRWWSK